MSESKKGKKETESINHIDLSTNVFVIEKEHRNENIHKQKITGIQNWPSAELAYESEFISCGVEQAFKLWDKND